MYRNFNDLKKRTMEAKDYLKSKSIWLGTTVADMKAPESYYSLEKMLEQYHQAKLKLLDIPVVVQQSELLIGLLTMLEKEGGNDFINKAEIVAMYQANL